MKDAPREGLSSTRRARILIATTRDAEPPGRLQRFGARFARPHRLIHPAEGSNVAGLADIEKSYVDLLFALADSDAKAE